MNNTKKQHHFSSGKHAPTMAGVVVLLAGILAFAGCGSADVASRPENESASKQTENTTPPRQSSPPTSTVTDDMPSGAPGTNTAGLPEPKPDEGTVAVPDRVLSTSEIQAIFSQLPDGATVSVRGRIRLIRFIGGSALMRLYGPNEPLEVGGSNALNFPAPQFFRMAFNASVDALRPEQEVVVTGKVSHSFECVMECSISERGAIPENAPAPIAFTTDAVETKNADRINMLKLPGVKAFGQSLKLERAFSPEPEGLPRELFSALAEATSIHTLEVTSAINQKIVDQIAECRHLQEVTVGGDLPKPDLTGIDLSPLQKLPSLTTLRFSLCQHMTDEHFRQLEQLPCLQFLAVGFPSDSKLSDAALTSIGKISSLRFLRMESISPFDFSDEGYNQFAGLSRLMIVDVGGNQISGSCFAALAKLPELQNLNLDGDFSDDSVTMFAQQEWPALSRLKIRSFEFGDDGFSTLISSLSPGMRHLKIGASNVSDKGLDALHQTMPKQLISLDLSGTKITDDGAKSLTDLASLEVLVLPNEISGSTIEELAKVLPNTRVYAAF